MARKKQETVHNFLQRALYDASDPLYERINNFLAFVTLVSVFSLVISTTSSLVAYSDIFVYIEVAAVFIFTLEYIARVYAHRSEALVYMFSVFGLIDLISIVPTYLSFSSLIFLKTARIARILVFLRVVRISKLVRTKSHHKSLRDPELELYDQGFAFRYFLAICLVLVTFAASSLYALYGSSHVEFQSIPVAMMWTLKNMLFVSTDVTIHSVGLELTTIVLRTFGLLVVGVAFYFLQVFLKRHVSTR